MANPKEIIVVKIIFFIFQLRVLLSSEISRVEICSHGKNIKIMNYFLTRLKKVYYLIEFALCLLTQILEIIKFLS